MVLVSHMSVCVGGGGGMHVKSLSQGLNIDLAQPGVEPGTF